MKMFDEEYNRTTQKMADMVMEYASQYAARSYLDEYEKAEQDKNGAFVSHEFDEKMYKLILREVKWESGLIWRITAKVLKVIAGLLLFFCVIFTLYVLLNEPLREMLLSLIQAYVS